MRGGRGRGSGSGSGGGGGQFNRGGMRGNQPLVTSF